MSEVTYIVICLTLSYLLVAFLYGFGNTHRDKVDIIRISNRLLSCADEKLTLKQYKRITRHIDELLRFIRYDYSPDETITQDDIELYIRRAENSDLYILDKCAIVDFLKCVNVSKGSKYTNRQFVESVKLYFTKLDSSKII